MKKIDQFLSEEQISVALQDAQQLADDDVLTKKDFVQVATEKRAKLEKLLRNKKNI